MKSKISSFTVTLLLLAIVTIPAFLLNSCRCIPCEQKQEAIVPVNILKNANEIIISRTGEKFFQKYITPDFDLIKHDSSGDYRMVYDFYMPDKQYVDTQILFTVDSTGNLDREKDIIGIPNCNDYPQECKFNINHSQAEKIAKSAGLVKGIKPWKTGFIWNQKLRRYVWHVLSIISESNDSTGYSGKGEEVVIAPDNGDILEFNSWHIN